MKQEGDVKTSLCHPPTGHHYGQWRCVLTGSPRSCIAPQCSPNGQIGGHVFPGSLSPLVNSFPFGQELFGSHGSSRAFWSEGERNLRQKVTAEAGVRGGLRGRGQGSHIMVQREMSPHLDSKTSSENLEKFSQNSKLI